MGDFREEIERVKRDHTKSDLIGELANRLGERATSVNPLATSMFRELRPGTKPVEYAQRSEDWTEDTSRVATRAIGLKILLHEQVGRPLYEPVESLVKQDFAECLVAVDAHRGGQDYGMGVHTPTTLPLDVDGFVEEPPDRSNTPPSSFDEIADLTSSHGRSTVESNFSVGESPYYVYVFDCTPPVSDEPSKLYDCRRAVQTKIESGKSVHVMEPKERATYALNQGKRVYYVGSTSNVLKRVSAHLSGTDKSGVSFTNTLPPRTLVEVERCKSKTEAFSLEGELARELAQMDGVFAYSDEMYGSGVSEHHQRERSM